MDASQLSFVHGTSDTKLLYQTIGAALEDTARKWGDREAVVVRHQGVRWTYAELDALADRLAVGLMQLGLKPGERIGIWAPNRAEWVLTQFATAKLGLILVNINPAYRVSELEYALNKVECRALVLADTFKTSNYLEMIESLAPELAKSEPGHLKSAKLPNLEMVIKLGNEARPGFLTFQEVEAKGEAGDVAPLRAISAALQPDEAINIQFTSGTTGSPKGATLSHFNILNNGLFCGQVMRFTEADRVCIPVPLYHCFGMVIGNLGCVTHGACMVYASDAFEPGPVLETIEAEKCTAVYGVPTMFIAELDHPEFAKFDLSSLRTGAMGGSPCPVEVMKRVISDMGMSEVTIAYGMTETSPASFMTSPDDPTDRRVSTVGRVMPHVMCKIVDQEGRIVPRGQQGELCTRGYSVMKGYWNDPERTADAVDDAGWMHTGDLAVLDEEGYGNIVGRVKDMVIRGGENIYPREVEEFLYTNPKIRDVSVFGVPDDRLGEELVAWIVLKDGQAASAEEIQTFCKGQIAHYKIPKHVRFVEDFPMTVTGKVQKFVMRERMSEDLGRKEQKTA